MEHDYSSTLCLYCGCTDYGSQTVNTGPWNSSEGKGCEDAFEKYLEANPDATETTIEEMF